MKLLDNGLVFIVALSALAFLFPPVFVFFLPYLPYLLALVMLLMGITLKGEDLLKAIRNWRFAMLGTFLQFLCMPLIAYVLTVLFQSQLPLEYKVGLVLVGTCPGGTASNVIVYLFKGDVSLSVLMTFMSTILSVVLTPFLLEFYVGTQMDLPTQKMILDIFILVIVPIAAGYTIQRFIKPESLQVFDRYASYIALAVIGIIIAAIVAANADMIHTLPLLLVCIVALHNISGMALGYIITRFFTKEKTIARTIAIEVGMQNSGLGVVLANLHFTKAVALPSAIFSFWHNVSGIGIANYWKKADIKKAR